MLDLTLPTPAENLALDEALLDAGDAGGLGESLRFWEPRDHFVVVGYANRAATEVNLEACREMGVPILRRCSGGGTVLQGPGCLNYNLVLRIDARPELATVTSTNRFIMQRNVEALNELLGTKCLVRGHTDLALGDRKFSGNSQRRRQHCLVFHGTFLLNFDLPMIERLLRFPSQQPDYRQSRAHRDFLTNLGLAAAAVKAALIRAWDAQAPLDNPPFGTVEKLVREKYARNDWNGRR